VYTQESIERVKEAVDMVALVGARTDLRRVGTRYTGLCPFHDERTPSFSVDAERKLYYCFGCGVGGDAIRFVQETEGQDFTEAIEVLAERTGVQLERAEEDPLADERRRRRQRLYALLDRTAGFYATYLWESPEGGKARAYLLERGLPEQTLRHFRVGWSPKAWDRVLTGAQREGYSEQELAAADLVRRGRGGGLYDRFRGRIMFPLADGRGRVVGFGARVLGEGDGDAAKYVNTSEGEVFHKRRQLFGIDRARAPAAKAKRVVVVEGYTDVLALHAAGIGEAVAIMGTALTQEQLSELARAVGSGGRIFLALDADRSGQEAMLRAARGASELDAELLVAPLPEGSDPADLVAAGGADAILGPLRSALSVLEFEVRRSVESGDLGSPAGRDRVLEEARALIAQAPERSAVRDHLVRLVSDRLDVPSDYVTARLGAGPPTGGPPEAATAPGPVASGGDASLAAEREFLALCASAGALGREFLERTSDEHLSSETMRRARDHLREHFEDPLADLPEDDPVLAALVTGVAMRGQEGAASEPVLRMSFLQLEHRRVERELRRAKRDGDLERQRELADARQDVRRELDSVMGQTV
jgi:DNA primase